MRSGSPARRLVALILAFLVAAAAPLLAQPVTSTEFDCTATHAFTGFGLNVWPLPGRLSPLLSVTDQLGVKFVRWKILPDTENADVPDAASFDALVEWLERLTAAQNAAGQRGLALFQRLRISGLEQIAASWAVPRKWQVGGLDPGQGNKERLIQNARIDDYGRLLAAAMTVLERHGIRPHAIELLNEPTNKLLPEAYVQVLKSFRFWQTWSGTPATQVAGPGTVFTWGNRPFLQRAVQNGEEFDLVSTHAYDALKTRQLTSLKPLLDAIPADWRKPIYVTEYGIDANLWYQTADAVETVPYGVRAAAQTLALFGSGANALFYWEAQDPPWSKQRWGLLSKEDRPRPAIGALRTILRPLQVGDNIVASPGREEAVPAMLVARPSQMVLQVANPRPERQDYEISFRNCTVGPISVVRSEAWPADRELGVRLSADGGLRLTLPGDTVASVTTSR